MNKYLIVILALVIIIIFAADWNYKGGMQAQHFDNGEISFDYPGNLNVTNGTGSNVVTFSDNSGLNITVIKQSIPPGYNLADRASLNGIGNIDKNFQLVSTKNITIGGANGYESNYNLQGNNGPQQRIEVWFEKNNALYGIISTSPGETKSGGSGFDVSAAGGDALNTIVNSIKINDTGNNPTKSTGWAELIMPTVNGNWPVNSHSVNDYGVYHISNSYYPGEDGQMALLGHHTTHSAPFAGLVQLKVGDPVIVKDYLTQKKYTYQVTSNGDDIRWGVRGVDINYQPSSTPELWLITCWPTGYSRAAYVVHSTLVSVEPLD